MGGVSGTPFWDEGGGWAAPIDVPIDTSTGYPLAGSSPGLPASVSPVDQIVPHYDE